MKINYKKLSIIALITAAVLIVASLIIFKISENPRDAEYTKVNQIALKKTPIKQVKENYHLNRDVKSLGVYGINKSKKYYFVYLPKTKKGYLYQNTKGFSKTKILNKFKVSHQNREVTAVNLGWYKKRPVWEVSYKKKNGKIGFVIYSFETGTELSYIDNL